jgi:branched-chain amino acid transport system ATP-binding protein
MALLKISNVTKSFGKMNALLNVESEIEEKELLAVIGPNGAGKTTLFNVITGKYRPTEGEVIFRGEKISSMPTYKIINRGISRSFQVVNLLPDLTVFDNVRVGALAYKKLDMNLFRSVAKLQYISEEVWRILDLVQLSEKANVVANVLSHGDQKCLEMGIALTNHPKLLLLDEPTAGMSAEETRYTIDLIKDIWEKTGVTIIFTEHDLEVVFSIATRIIVLQMGQIIASGSVNEIKENQRVKQAYLGEET